MELYKCPGLIWPWPSIYCGQFETKGIFTALTTREFDISNKVRLLLFNLCFPRNNRLRFSCFKWAKVWRNHQFVFGSSRNLDQPGYPYSLIRVFAFRSTGVATCTMLCNCVHAFYIRTLYHWSTARLYCTCNCDSKNPWTTNISFAGYIVYRVTYICRVFAWIMNRETNCSNIWFDKPRELFCRNVSKIARTRFMNDFRV